MVQSVACVLPRVTHVYKMVSHRHDHRWISYSSSIALAHWSNFHVTAAAVGIVDRSHYMVTVHARSYIKSFLSLQNPERRVGDLPSPSLGLIDLRKK